MCILFNNVYYIQKFLKCKFFGTFLRENYKVLKTLFLIMVFSCYENLKMFDSLYILIFMCVLSYQIVISTKYHSYDNIILWFLDHDVSLNVLLLAGLIMHKRNLWRMRGVPCAGVIFFSIFILRLIFPNIC